MTTPLADRLRAAFGSSLRVTAPAPPERLAAEPAALPGIELETAAGPCFVHELRLAARQVHGGLPLDACLELPSLALACLIKSAAPTPLDLRQAVFLDTETTGLAGGTGTAAFLVGIAFFADSGGAARVEDTRVSHAPTLPRSHSFVVRQFFMRDFGEERALLLALEEALAPFRYVVTFNGKSFDLPLLETRYTLARLRRDWRPELHLDLIHPARRLWRERLPSCSLSAIEEAVLGHRREADVPSWAIPALYANYLRFGESGPLGRVFSHNRHDLLSLAALAAHLGHRLADPLGMGLGPDELLAVARLYEELGRRTEAVACLEAALPRAESPLRERLQLLLALYCKRAGRRERAFELWRELAHGPAALAGLLELAKHYEHHRRDASAALDVVEQALVVLELREARDGPACWRAERADLERRHARLLRKRGLRR